MTGGIKSVMAYGQLKNGHHSEKWKSIVIQDVLHFQTLSLEEMIDFFILLGNATWTHQPDPP